MTTSDLILIYAASMSVSIVGWFGCGTISNQIVRGASRAIIIALLCAPGILVGHGIGVSPTLFALYVQPYPFTLSSIFVTWLLLLAVIFGVPGLRKHRNGWPPTLNELLWNPGAVIFVVLGLVAAMLLTVLVVEDREAWWWSTLQYSTVLSGAAVNLFLSYGVVSVRQTNPYITPLYFALPISLAAAPIVTFFWFGTGLIGALAAVRRHAFAIAICLMMFGLMVLYSLHRAWLAVDAPAHVKIGGGVGGNLTIAVVCFALGLTGYVLLKRHNRNNNESGK